MYSEFEPIFGCKNKYSILGKATWCHEVKKQLFLKHQNRALLYKNAYKIVNKNKITNYPRKDNTKELA